MADLDFAALGGMKMRAKQMTSTPNSALYYFATLHSPVGTTGKGGTSTTSVTPGTGSKTFAVQSGLGWVAGDPIRVFSAANAANFVDGTVTSYSGTSLVVNATSYGGVAATDWIVSPLSASVDTYSSTNMWELATGTAYTAGGKTCGTMSQSVTAIDCPDVVWTTGASETITAAFCAIWVNSANSITGAQLVGVKDTHTTPAVASNGGTLTQPINMLLTMS